MPRSAHVSLQRLDTDAVLQLLKMRSPFEAYWSSLRFAIETYLKQLRLSLRFRLSNKPRLEIIKSERFKQIVVQLLLLRLHKIRAGVSLNFLRIESHSTQNIFSSVVRKIFCHAAFLSSSAAASARNSFSVSDECIKYLVAYVSVQPGYSTTKILEASFTAELLIKST